jgi:hypothetical protein
MSQLPLIKYVDNIIQMSTEVSNSVKQNLVKIILNKTGFHDKIYRTINEKTHGVLELILIHVTSKDGHVFFHTC